LKIKTKLTFTLVHKDENRNDGLWKFWNRKFHVLHQFNDFAFFVPSFVDIFRISGAVFWVNFIYNFLIMEFSL